MGGAGSDNYGGKKGWRRRDVVRGLAVAGLGSRFACTAGLVRADEAGVWADQTLDWQWNPLRRMTAVTPDGLRLHARDSSADIGNGVQGTAWLLNDSLPSPLIRVRKGDPFRVRLDNDLPDALILHWHGLTPPEPMDGHPRLAVAAGKGYDYDFVVENRAATYWYHSHSHYRVGKHAYLGVAGMLIVDDDEEAALPLPRGDREIPLILQDRRFDPSGEPVPYGIPDTMEGLIGNEPFGNGVNRPQLELGTAIYRLRILNGSNARIFRLARSDRKPLYVIGNDAGLLDRTRQVNWVDMAPGERIDMLLDLRDARVGDRLLLGSEAFFISEGIARAQDMNRQGHPMALMQIHVNRREEESLEIPDALLPVPGPNPADAVHERQFILSSDRDSGTRTMMSHQINGLTYRMGRIDETVPFGQTEIWTFTNHNIYSHPIHLHATHFRVLSRRGGRNEVMPWEAGLKDTVLVHPQEEVRVAVRFDAHPGLFLLHCHNLEHEDVGMMLNILVEA